METGMDDMLNLLIRGNLLREFPAGPAFADNPVQYRVLLFACRCHRKSNLTTLYMPGYFKVFLRVHYMSTSKDKTKSPC
jgi:hypothetical protein